MLHSLVLRLVALEARAHSTEDVPGEGLSSVLAFARAHHLDAVPLACLPNADLDAKIADLIAEVAAGVRGFTPLLLEALEKERVQRPAALALAPPGTRQPP